MLGMTRGGNICLSYQHMNLLQNLVSVVMASLLVSDVVSVVLVQIKQLCSNWEILQLRPKRFLIQPD